VLAIQMCKQAGKHPNIKLIAGQQNYWNKKITTKRHQGSSFFYQALYI